MDGNSSFCEVDPDISSPAQGEKSFGDFLFAGGLLIAGVVFLIASLIADLIRGVNH